MYLIPYSGQLLSKVEALGQEGILGCEASVRCKVACSFPVKRGVPYITEDPYCYGTDLLTYSEFIQYLMYALMYAHVLLNSNVLFMCILLKE